MVSAPAERIEALDLLRGLAVAGMILVTSPGDWGQAYGWLRHADWHGWTLADMVFPMFLFAVGMAMGLSFPRPYCTPANRRALWWRTARRTAALIALGLALESTLTLAIALGAPHVGEGGLDHLRLPGILQRIALCYALGMAIMVVVSRRDATGGLHPRLAGLAAASAVLLAGYWALLAFVPVPGVGAGGMTPSTALPGYVDRLVFGVPHLWPFGWEVPGGPVFYDPEGLVSTISATVNVLLGAMAGLAWRRHPARAPLAIAVAGALLFVAGWLLDPLEVINKRLWTSSFALLSAGFAALMLVGMAIANRWDPTRRLAAPLRVLGGNAILAFALSQLLGRVYGFPLGADPGSSPQGTLDRVALGLAGDPRLASFLCALLVLALITLLILPLHRRGIHLRL